MTVRQAMAAVALTALTTGAAQAADQTILGKGLTVKSPSTPDRRSVKVIGREKGSPNNIVGDPTSGGATLTINLTGGTPSTQTFTLNQGTSSTGQPFWRAAGSTGFKYKDSKGDQTAVKGVLIKASPGGTFTLKIKISGRNDGGTNLVPPNPGTGGCAALAIGGGDTYNVLFDSSSSIKNKDGQLFKAKNPQNEGTCGVTTTTTSTTITLPTTTTNTTTTVTLPTTTTNTTTTVTTTSLATTTTTTLYGSPSRAFTERVLGLLD